MKLGFIGLGKMGRPMSVNLLKAGHELTVHNRSRAVVDELAAQGAKPAGSPAEVVAAADVVQTCLPTPASVDEVYDALFAAARPGQGVEGAKRHQVVGCPDPIDPRVSGLQPDHQRDRKSTRLNSSHVKRSRMPSSA